MGEVKENRASERASGSEREAGGERGKSSGESSGERASGGESGRDSGEKRGNNRDCCEKYRDSRDISEEYSSSGGRGEREEWGWPEASMCETIQLEDVAGVVGERLVVKRPLTPPHFKSQRGNQQSLQILIEGNTSTSSCLRGENGSLYEINEKLANSIYGEVRRGHILQASQEQPGSYSRIKSVVIKIIHTNRLSSIKHENPYMEMSVMQHIESGMTHLSKQVDCIVIGKRLHSIMPNDGEELLSLAGRLSTLKVKKYFRQIVSAVKQLQSLHVSHRDLTLENVVLNKETDECTVIDFGMAIPVPHARKSRINVLLNEHSRMSEGENDFRNSMMYKQFRGDDCTTDNEDESVEDEIETLLLPPQGVFGKETYVCPEILQNTEPFDGMLIDNWSLGVILFSLFTGRAPFKRAAMSDKWFCRIQREHLSPLLRRWKIYNIPAGAVDLLDKMLKRGVNPQARLTTTDILSHPWLME